MFYEVLPWYLAIGMTNKEFWEDDPYLTVVYRKKHLLERENENQKMWVQGLYNRKAFSSALSQLFAKNDTDCELYYEKPLDIFGIHKEDKAEIEKKQNEAIFAQLNALSLFFGDGEVKKGDGN